MYAQYLIEVQAYNSRGTGPKSEEIIAMTSEGVPSEAPGEVRCSTLSSKSIYILWDPPHQETTNGILRGYKVLYKPAREWYNALQQSRIVQIPKMTLLDLEVNTNYSIQVLGFTKVGDGKKSEAIYCKTHEDVPEPPLEIRVLPSSSESVVVSWKPSNKTKGSVSHYNIYYKPLQKGQEMIQQTEQLTGKDASVQASEGDNDFLEIPGLEKNRKYMFWVTANSALGESPASIFAAQTVADKIVPAKSISFDDVIKTPWKQNVIMPCAAVGIPSPQKKWTIGNEPVSESGHIKFRQDGALVISKVTSDDSGDYKCAVYNEHGKDQVYYKVIVQVPPSAPKVSIISKTKDSIQVQWKPGPHGGEPIRGFLLFYKRERDDWMKKELRPEHGLYTLEDLACGTTYQVYMKAFNNIGTGAACDIITVATDGAESEPPSKQMLMREGSTFITVNVDAWPSSGCPVEHFGVEYKELTSTKEQWIVVGSKVSPLQKKLLISGLKTGTRYLLRVHVHSSAGNSVFEYRVATLTASGATISPDLLEELKPVYIFYLDPLIFVPAVALLVVVIVASAIVCVVVKRRSESEGTPSLDMSLEPSQMNTWVRNSRMFPPDYSQYTYRTSTMSSRRTSKDPTPYATTHMSEYYPEMPCASTDVGRVHLPVGDCSGTWKKRVPITPTCPDWRKEAMKNSAGNNAGVNETAFVFPSTSSNMPADVTSDHHLDTRSSDDYDPPPKAHMNATFLVNQDNLNDNAQLLMN